MSKEKLENKAQEFDASMFELVNKDINAKIHDQKFETKATTFAKDALKRFAKNRSSVVGAVIIGILLLGSFLSFFSPHDIKNAQTDEALLPGKLFESGTGWWDGTLVYNNIAWDEDNQCPAEFDARYVQAMYYTEKDSYIDQYFKYAKGGYMRVTTDEYCRSESSQNSKLFYINNYTPITISDSENLKLYIGFDHTDDLADAKYAHSYKVTIVKGDEKYDATTWSTDFSPVTVDLSKCLRDNAITSIENCNVYIYFKATIDENKFSYILFDKVLFTSDDANKQAILDTINIADANKTSGYGPDSAGVFPVGYWRSNCFKNIYHARYSMVTFRYDLYGYTFGDRTNFIVGESIFKEYIANGWCEFTNFDDISTFRVLDEAKCPVKAVHSYSIDGGVRNYITTTTYYKYKGYSKPPKYLFGTDSIGHDLFTVALSSLKTSLLVAIISSTICLVIGLIWGSVSGYFGGNVDIVMERITDILGGVPWIVMMTLVILLLGNSVVTFGIALVLTGWIGTASRTRTQFYRFKGREYVLASRTLGASDARLIFRHILPNGLGTIVTGSVLMIPSCIFSEATISYLGLGLKGINSFGVLLSDNQMYLSTRPLLIIVPAIIISLLMISFNLFGNGLRDALNPTLKGGEQ